MPKGLVRTKVGQIRRSLVVYLVTKLFGDYVGLWARDFLGSPAGMIRQGIRKGRQ